MTSHTRSLLAASFVAALFSFAAAAQGGAQTRPSGPAADYIVGAQDVLMPDWSLILAEVRKHFPSA